MNNFGYLGLVEGGSFRTLAAERGAPAVFRLTTIAPNAAAPPESGEIPLAEYEFMAIMVRGLDSGDWIYSATVTEVASPILTAVVRAVFERPADLDPFKMKFLER